MGHEDILKQAQKLNEEILKSKLGIAEMAEAAFRNSEAHGFYDGVFNFGEKIALIHSEASEALEEHRAGNVTTTTYEYKQEDGSTIKSLAPTLSGIAGKPVGMLSELADIIIRVGDLAGSMGASEELEKVVREKMAYNATRPYKHGKKY